MFIIELDAHENIENVFGNPRKNPHSKSSRNIFTNFHDIPSPAHIQMVAMMPIALPRDCSRMCFKGSETAR